MYVTSRAIFRKETRVLQKKWNGLDESQIVIITSWIQSIWRC